MHLLLCSYLFNINVEYKNKINFHPTTAAEHDEGNEEVSAC
jgi:hypothetical protein